MPITESPATAAPSSTPSSTTTQTAVADLGPEVVEDAITGTIGCTIDEEFGRGRSQVGYLLTALGPDGVEQPHEAIDGSCTCGVEPTGSQNYVVVRFVDSGQASAMATWLSGGDRCRPIATVGSWMLFSIKDLAQPQASDEFEAAVTALGGELITTCR